MTESYEDEFKKRVENRVSPGDEIFRGTLSPQMIKDLDLKKLYHKVVMWGEKSAQGLLCGIYGCNSPPDVTCKHCNCTYCPEHIEMHFHSIENKDGIHLEKID